MNKPSLSIASLQQAMVLNDNRAVYRSRFLLDQDLSIGHYSSLSTVDLVLTENTAYLADQNEGLLIIDVSNPYQPALTGSLPMFGTPWKLSVNQAIACVADGTAGVMTNKALMDSQSASHPKIKPLSSIRSHRTRADALSKHSYPG